MSIAFHYVDTGLIPACAGKTLRSDSYRVIPRAHPRVCGENEIIREAMADRGGSSPRVRGKPRTERT